METLAREIILLLQKKGLTLGAVESATGGLISHLITGVPSSSTVYAGAITSYSNEVKIKVVGVKAAIIKRYGAVSAPVARQMATAGRKLLGVDICVSDTGIAGPTGGSKEKPVGLFYLGLATADGTQVRKHIFHGTREENQMRAALAALGWVREWVEEI